MSLLRISSTVTCPACGSQETRDMPTDACTYFYPCPACGVTSKPKTGDCCVFCSYGDTRCPPMQAS